MQISIQCGFCGKDILKSSYDIHGHSAYFCDRVCQSAWQKASGVNTGPNNPRWKEGSRIMVACDNCQKEFVIKRKQVVRYKHHYCSRACKWQKWHAEHRGETHPSWKGQHITITCDMCGKEAKKYRFQLEGHNHHFCSSACRYRWLSECMVWPTGPDHPSWIDGLHNEYYGPNWLAQQRAARKRDGYKCRYCGKTQKKNGRALDVHHIRPFRSFGYIANQNDRYLQANDLTNLIALCRICHRRAEAGNIPIQPYLL